MINIIVWGNTAGWCGRSWNDILKIKNAKLINEFYPSKSRFMELLIRLHFSERINSIIRLPLKRIWYDYFIDNMVEDRNSEMLVIVYDGNKVGIDEGFLKYFKSECRNAKLVYVITNEIQYSIATRKGFYHKLSLYYDIIYGFHLPDAEKYGIDIIPLVYSKNDLKHDRPKKTMFFAGEAKTRMPRILKVYEKLKQFGFSARIVALHVDKDSVNCKFELNDEVVFNKFIPYDDVIRYTQEAGVIVEVPQDGLEAVTIKTCEAIYYNKLLISMNPLLKEMPFYDSRYMLYIESPDDITLDFLSNWDKVRYNQEAIDYFSVNTFLNRIFIDLKINNK